MNYCIHSLGIKNGLGVNIYLKQSGVPVAAALKIFFFTVYLVLFKLKRETFSFVLNEMLSSIAVVLPFGFCILNCIPSTPHKSAKKRAANS
jgi:hypothetical protein